MLDNIPIPNNKKFPYVNNILIWARLEYKRDIKLYYLPFDAKGKDLTEEQIQKLHDLADTQKNIKVIDLYDSYKSKYDLDFFKNESINFAHKIDLARIFALVEHDGPAIYFDFDVKLFRTVVEAEGEKGCVKLSEIPINEYGLSMYFDDRRERLENSIIAVESGKNCIVLALLQVLIQEQKLTSADNVDKYDCNQVWKELVNILKIIYSIEQKIHTTLSKDELLLKVKEYLEDPKKMLELK